MAGTDRSKRPALGGPAVILVEPQLGENIGMVARAMLNCGLTDLRLVNPRDPWPNAAARAAASGAVEVLDAARLFATAAAAVADLQRVLATTARSRDMALPVLTPRRAAEDMRSALGRGERAGILFGPERAGLNNDDVALADAVLMVPLNPAFASLNLAQAVLIVGYEWFQAAAPAAPRRLERRGAVRATKADLLHLFARLEWALDESGFLHPVEKRPT